MSMTMKRRTILTVCSAFLAVATLIAASRSWPEYIRKWQSLRKQIHLLNRLAAQLETGNDALADWQAVYAVADGATPETRLRQLLAPPTELSVGSSRAYDGGGAYRLHEQTFEIGKLQPTSLEDVLRFGDPLEGLPGVPFVLRIEVGDDGLVRATFTLRYLQ